MYFESTIRLGVKKEGELSYVLYDELDLYVEGDISIEQEVLIGNIETLRVSKAEHSDKGRTAPIYDTLGITADQYAAYWEYVENYSASW